MAYQRITWLAEALRNEGCRVSEYSGWTTRGRPASTGGFSPIGVLWHHTGTTTSDSRPAPTLPMCINGNPQRKLPGPLCHAVIGYDGIVYVIAAGRANHAGIAQASGPMPKGDGNELYVGFEIDYDGKQPMSEAQYGASILAATAVIRYLDKTSEYCRGHKETSVTGKWDPGGYNLATMRAEVKVQLTSGGKPSKPSSGGGDDWLANPADVWAVEWGRSGQSAMNFIDTLDELSSQKTWSNKPWSSADPPSAGVALQRIYTWVQDMDKRLAAIEEHLGIGGT